jgi:hypothetical protein
MYTGNKAALNNFGVQAVQLAQTLSAGTGNWGNPNPAVGFSPFYARFASASGTSTIISDAATALATNGTFFMFWLGMDDFLLHAAFGGDATKAPLVTLGGAPGPGTGFTAAYNAALNALLNANPNAKGVVANFPSIFAMPHFTSVAWNAIPLDATTAGAANASFAGYNQILDALKGAPFNYPAAEVNARKITFAAGNNAIVIADETLNDYGDEFDLLESNSIITNDQRQALIPYEQVRQTTAADVLPLSAGTVLGTLAVSSNPLSIIGVAVPLADQYVIIPSEKADIEAARVAFNTVVANAVTANSTRLALADVNAGLNALLASQLAVVNKISVTPNINPPTGIYSEDGLHPNSRGYAFIANIFIDAINAKFSATVPKVNISKYSATALPIP